MELISSRNNLVKFGRGKDKSPRKKRANLRNHALGGALVGGVVGNAITKPITVPIELVGGLAGSAIGAGAGAATYGARRAWRGGKALVAKLRGKEPEKYDYMKSLSRMTAEFARKDPTLGGHTKKGAKIGAIAGGLAYGGATLALGRKTALSMGMGNISKGKLAAAGAIAAGLGAAGGGALGAAGGAGTYGVKRATGMAKPKQNNSPFQSARKRFGM